MPQKKQPTTQVPGTIVLDAEAVAKLANGMTEAKLASIREVLAKRNEIASMRGEDVEKLARIVEAGRANGGCFIGCA